MPIVRVSKRGHPFVQVDKRPLEDPRLSWKSKGLIGYLLSRPDSWVITIQHLITISPDGRTAVQAALQELKRYGYAQLRQVRSLDGSKAAGKEWVIFEHPSLTSGFSDSQENLTIRKSASNNNELIKDNEKPPREEAAAIFSAWCRNELGIASITDKRLKALRARLRDPFFRRNWGAAIKRAARSKFCRGEGSRGWKANIDWFLRPDTVPKLMEGFYDSTKKETPQALTDADFLRADA